MPEDNDKYITQNTILFSLADFIRVLWTNNQVAAEKLFDRIILVAYDLRIWRMNKYRSRLDKIVPWTNRS